MKRRVHKSPQALDDLAEQGAFIGSDNVDAEFRFYEATEAAFDRLVEMPLIGVRVETSNTALTRLRRWRVPGFENHLIFYRVTDESIEVIRVLHGARDIESILSEE